MFVSAIVISGTTTTGETLCLREEFAKSEESNLRQQRPALCGPHPQALCPQQDQVVKRPWIIQGERILSQSSQESGRCPATFSYPGTHA